MRRSFVWVLCLAALPGSLQAQEPEVVRLTVTPAPAPVPVLKYQLLPPLFEMQPGNQIQGFMKCFFEQQNFFFNEDVVKQREEFLEMPLDQLAKENPLEQGYASGPNRMADEAALFDRADWQILLAVQREGVNLLLPEVQQMRALAITLKVRLRAQVALDRHEDAIRGARTMFVLARSFEEHPSLIGHLVGLAVTRITLDGLGELVGRPGCPNLYWALSDLPDPILRLDTALRGELAFVTSEFSRFPTDRPMRPDELAKANYELTQRLDWAWEQNEGEGRKLSTHIRELSQDEDHVAKARQELIEAGEVGKEVETFPALQVVWLHTALRWKVGRDSAIVLMRLPPPEAFARLKQVTEQRQAAGDVFAFQDGRPYATVLQSHLRVCRQVAMLRLVEAVRHHAANHDGQFPARLADIELPVPTDPYTGKPFAYRLENGTAVIESPLPELNWPKASPTMRYELTLAK